MQTYFYPRPPRGGRHYGCALPEDLEKISIHALREEGDSCRVRCWSLRLYFYPRPPRGGRPLTRAVKLFSRIFLSTPSARRATYSIRPGQYTWNHFYPRPPRGGRRQMQPSRALASRISIHALREEGDWSPQCGGTIRNNFYPRPPRGGRQQKQRQNLYFQTNYTTFCTNLEEP